MLSSYFLTTFVHTVGTVEIESCSYLDLSSGGLVGMIFPVKMALFFFSPTNNSTLKVNKYFLITITLKD
jgi:hypothetical protein